MGDSESLVGCGVWKMAHQDILLRHLPCGCTVREAMTDKTPWQTNAPRALLICHWKGMVAAFAELEIAQRREGEV